MGKSRTSFAQNLSVSYECALAIGNSLNLEQMLHQVIHTIVQKTSAVRGIIWLKNREAELIPVASAGIRISDALNEDRLGPLRSVFKQIQQRGRFVLRNKDDEDFLQYFAVPTGKEEAVLIVPVNNLAILHLVYDSMGVADEALGNMLASLSQKLSTAIDACVIYENMAGEISGREAIENDLRKKTDEVISSQEELQRLYAESEESRRSLLSILEDVSEREHALRESEKKYRNLIDQSQDVIYLLYEGKFELINKRFKEILGYTLKEVNDPDFQFMNLVAPRSKAMVEKRREKLARGKRVPPRYEFTALSRDGSEIEVETSVSYTEYKGGIATQGIVRDITERKQAEKRIEHLNLVLRAIRNVNQVITREKDRDRLLKGVCETLIETRGYHHGWIAIFDDSGGLLTIAQAGLDILPLVEYLRRGELPVCAWRAFQQSEVVVMEEMPSDCADCPLAAEHPGTRTMTVRLAHAGKVYGVLNVSLVAGLNAHEEEEALFGEVADDVALALHSIELEKAHKRMDREIEERREYLASVLRHVPDAIVTEDAGKRIVEWNLGAERLFGYSRDEAQGKDVDDLIARPDVEEQARFFTKQALAGEGIPPTEVARYRKDGTPVSVILATSPITIEGELHGAVAVYTDITERKRMEREIEERREYLASVLRHVPDAIVTLDTANRIVEWNPGAERLYGYTYDEVIGRDIDDVVTRPDVREQAILFTKQSLSGKKIPPTEVARYRKDGTPVSVILATSLIMTGGELQGAVAVYTDITERKQAEEALQEAHDTLEIRVQERTADLARAIESLQAEIAERIRMQHQIEEQREYLASVLHHAPDAIITVNSSNRIVGWNPGAERLLGYSRDEAQGKDITGLVTRPDVEEQARFFSGQALSGKGVPPTEVVRYRKNGEPVNVILSISPIMIGGRAEGFVVIYTDITERKRAEEELRVKEMQLIHAGRLSSLGEMATGVAHEINQPLAIISMAAEGRLRDIQSGRFDLSILPQELEDILKNVRRIDRIITHMRTFARRTGEWESVDPEEVLDNVFILLGEQFRMHQISVSHEIEDGLPAIKVDANQLEQVFVNILTNARQVLDEKAEEAAGCGEAFEKRLVCSISRESWEEHEYVVFGFTDNAFGVADELKTRVFDPFFTSKEAGQGTGLGLSIAYSIVTQALGGKIWVEDNEMGGASFKVALPAGGEVRE